MQDHSIAVERNDIKANRAPRRHDLCVVFGNAPKTRTLLRIHARQRGPETP